ncbi:carbohydrate ABC transporter permease [Aureimonas fodinaquatilis]|uniref:Carbohydrate ABC transporter permease n=1 Tax=Aureimonas fodinaquatilis TaxID=2565783 RepID=A0A5B0DQD7_9HYPH|nr:carbohydrate ABC transporter permease [Aureimonas fodinaquatilis]KAA0969017.1 carbohydrate ABC transporter permease [Aureimonas fodinaquatilis]
MRDTPFVMVLRWVCLILALVVMLFPIYWMLNTALKPSSEIFQYPPTFWSANWSLDAFWTVLTERPIGRYFLNSLIVATGTTVLSLCIASLAAYGLTRFPIRIEALIILSLLFIKMLPEALLVVPFFQLIAGAGLLNNYIALILVYSSFALPFAVWMLVGFFRAIPRELDEAGIMDGASRIGTFALVVLPLAKPGLVAVAMVTFLTAWNAYLWSLVLTTAPSMYVLPVGIATLKGEYQVNWNELMAAAVIAVVPVLAIYSILERHLVAGITAGAVKG